MFLASISIIRGVKVCPGEVRSFKCATIRYKELDIVIIKKLRVCRVFTVQ
jgi:hypothetical protein